MVCWWFLVVLVVVVVFEGFDQLIHISPYMLYNFGIRVTRGVSWVCFYPIFSIFSTIFTLFFFFLFFLLQKQAFSYFLINKGTKEQRTKGTKEQRIKGSKRSKGNKVSK